MKTTTDQQITLRVRSETHEKLKFLASHRKATMNSIVKEALHEYLAYQLADLERDLTRTLETAKRYASSAESVDADLTGFVKAEMSRADPMQEVLTPNKSSEQEPKGELERKLEEVIG